MLRVLFSTIILLLSLPLSAQSRQEGVEDNLRTIDTLLSRQSPFQSLYFMPELGTLDVEDINSWAADMQKSKFAESGLEMSLGYENRFFDYDTRDDTYEGGDIIAYKHRFLVSLKWNIMQSGLIGRDNFRQKVEILARTKSQEVANSTIKSLVSESAEQQMTNLYGYYNVLIDAKVELYGVLIEMQKKLVASNRATMLSLSDMNIKRANVLRLRKSGVETRSGVIDVDSYVAGQQMYNGSEYDLLVENNNSIIKNKLDQELTLNEVNEISYWKKIDVSPYARVSNYLDEYNNQKNVGNVGVAASLPLFTNTKSKRSEVLSRGRLLANEEQLIREDISRQIDDLLQQLNENLATLRVLIESTKHYNEGCRLATQYYNKKSMTILDLSQRYIDSLDNNIEIYKFIMEREKMKYTLFKIVYGV